MRVAGYEHLGRARTVSHAHSTVDDHCWPVRVTSVANGDRRTVVAREPRRHDGMFRPRTKCPLTLLQVFAHRRDPPRA